MLDNLHYYKLSEDSDPPPYPSPAHPPTTTKALHHETICYTNSLACFVEDQRQSMQWYRWHTRTCGNATQTAKTTQHARLVVSMNCARWHADAAVLPHRECHSLMVGAPACVGWQSRIYT
jgi:hypothetical protein